MVSPLGVVWLFDTQLRRARLHHGHIVVAIALGLILPNHVKIALADQLFRSGKPGIQCKQDVAAKKAHIPVLPEDSHWRSFHHGLKQIV